MTQPVVTLTVELRQEGGFRELTTWKVEPTAHDLDQIKGKLRQLASELEGRQRLDLGDDGKA